MMRRPPLSTLIASLSLHVALPIYAVAAFVATLVVFHGLDPYFSARDAGRDPLFLQGVAEPVGIIASVCQHPLRFGQTVEQSGCASVIADLPRSEEHTSELQSLLRISYAVFCLNKTYIVQIE